MSDPFAWLQAAATEAEPVGAPPRRRLLELTDVSSKWAWTNDAACIDADPAIFFPNLLPPYPDEILDAAKAYCDTCPVRVTCHDHALHHESEGIWAGTDPAGRRKTRRALNIPDPASLGRDEVHNEAVGITPPLWEIDVNRSARETAEAAGVTRRTVNRHRAARRTTT